MSLRGLIVLLHVYTIESVKWVWIYNKKRLHCVIVLRRNVSIFAVKKTNVRQLDSMSILRSNYTWSIVQLPSLVAVHGNLPLMSKMRGDFSLACLLAITLQICNVLTLYKRYLRCGSSSWPLYCVRNYASIALSLPFVKSGTGASLGRSISVDPASPRLHVILLV